MLNREMLTLGSKRSVIRELYEFGKLKAEKDGAQNVFDFSLGNPNVPSPQCIEDALLQCAKEKDVHAYTSAQGDKNVRRAIAEHIRRTFGAKMDENHVYMTCGAAASLCITFRALCEKDDEIVIFTPYFPEYKVFVSSMGAKCVTCPCKDDFSIDFSALERVLSERTKAVVINSPNNPSGIVYSKQVIKKLCDLLTRRSQAYSHPIFLVCDEPYREIVYGADVPYPMNFYDDCVVCYSYSKSLSLPGERIGYVAVNPNAHLADELYFAICGAGRSLGYVCAPSTYQRVVEKCVDALPDVDAYRKNRDLLFDSLTTIGYECVRPDGAFYMMVRSLEDDANAFSERAKDFGLLLVPSDDFGVKGWVRIAYCVDYDMIRRSLPAFERLFATYKQ